MKDETKFIRTSITHVFYNRMAPALDGKKMTEKEYADSLVVQYFKTAKASRQKDLYDRINAKPLLPVFFSGNI